VLCRFVSCVTHISTIVWPQTPPHLSICGQLFALPWVARLYRMEEEFFIPHHSAWSAFPMEIKLFQRGDIPFHMLVILDYRSGHVFVICRLWLQACPNVIPGSYKSMCNSSSYCRGCLNRNC
jgi:hypothetical protein